MKAILPRGTIHRGSVHTQVFSRFFILGLGQASDDFEFGLSPVNDHAKVDRILSLLGVMSMGNIRSTITKSGDSRRR